MGGFSNFAISFTIISVLAGCLTSYYIAFNNGGPVAITWGWLIVGGFCILVALAMGEIASAMPTAAPVLLGEPARRACLGLVHRLVQPGGPDRGHRVHRLRRRDLHHRAAQPVVPDRGRTSTVTVFMVYTAIVALHLAINRINISFLGQPNSLSAWWHMLGVAVIVVVLALVPDRPPVGGVRVHADAEQLRDSADHSYWFVFGLGLLIAQYTDHRLRRLGAHERGDP